MTAVALTGYRLDLSAAVHPAVIGTAAGFLLIVRQPWQLDGRLFVEEAALAAAPVPIWHGFIHLVPWVSIRAGVGFLAFAIIVGLLAAFIASDRVGLGVGPALLLPLLPSDPGTGPLATVLNVHFILGIHLALLLVAKPSRWDAPTALFASLNGPACIILAPLYLWKRPRLAVVVVGPAILQVAVLLGSDRL